MFYYIFVVFVSLFVGFYVAHSGFGVQVFYERCVLSACLSHLICRSYVIANSLHKMFYESVCC